jgi:hypothetical protein
MSTIIRYIVIGTAALALSFTVACKDDSGAAKQEVTEGAESAGKAGATAGVEAGQEGGAKEGAKEGGKAAGEDAIQ